MGSFVPAVNSNHEGYQKTGACSGGIVNISFPSYITTAIIVAEISAARYGMWLFFNGNSPIKINGAGTSNVSLSADYKTITIDFNNNSTVRVFVISSAQMPAIS